MWDFYKLLNKIFYKLYDFAVLSFLKQLNEIKKRVRGMDSKTSYKQSKRINQAAIKDTTKNSLLYATKEAIRKSTFMQD